MLDDEPMIGRTIAHIAESAGLEARCATGSAEFFAEAAAWAPDVIVLDLIMPAMDGVQVIAELADAGCRAAIIITSGVDGRVLDAAGRSAAERGLHIAGVLAKPFLPAALREMLRHSLSAPGSPPAPRRAATGAPAVTRAELQRAVREHQLFMLYQPKLQCRSGALAGFEALVRWRHPVHGIIGPDRFLPLAEASALMDQITREVFAMSLTWFADLCTDTPDAASELSARTRAVMTLSINVSAPSLDNVALFDELEARCRALHIPPERVILELTETSAMLDPVASLDMLTRLRMRGFQLSIDDFGTGYSSMLQLVRLPFSEIKVDKSFVVTAGRSSESRSVIRSVIDLGRSLGLTSTAEGVEDAATLNYLRDAGCDLVQGYHIARPMPADEVRDWVREHDAGRESLRLKALQALDILDTPAERRFDRLTRLAQQIFRVPVALVSLVDEQRQWFKSHPGLDIRETARNISLCSHTIDQTSVMVVPDTNRDPRFSGNPLVTGAPHMRFYAGCPLHSSDGSAVGTLCLMDTVPRFMGPRERDILAALATLVERELLLPGTALHDPASALLDGPGFESRAHDTLEFCAAVGRPTGLVLLRLDGLDELARDHGEPSRQSALAAAGAALEQAFFDTDLLGRLGSQTFAVLLIGADREDAEQALQRSISALDAALARAGCAGSLTVSSGIADGHGHGARNLQALLAAADAALEQNRSRRTESALRVVSSPDRSYNSRSFFQGR
ncbi:MAG: EAL domain-containing protein [Gammaproteobacteria bacterium]|nr:EAL domain-containing protein [Gammaproteobacteria bacterium]